MFKPAVAKISQPTFKRDSLKRLEQLAQQKWTKFQSFQIDAPLQQQQQQQLAEKYFITFPYPYMNGRLHLGHAFTISKCEFAAGYQRMQGKRVLFPFGFHATGMPIKACADKLRDELAVMKSADHDCAKEGKQWSIMRDMGIPVGDIPRFSNAEHWLDYFPPLAKNDLEKFGLKVDWRRSFITTDRHPAFSSFVSWQFRRLKQLGYIKYGKRHSIWSPLDGQPCMDHDRQTGEGVQPQQWTLIKLPLTSSAGVKTTSLLAATLRPETMYGQTNCFVSPDLQYSIYECAVQKERFICLDRVYRNLSHQMPTTSTWTLIGQVEGKDLIGQFVNAPLASRVPVLPMPSISPNKGSGVVTSVPSDSPDDYITIRELKRKHAYFGLSHLKEALDAIQPIPIIESPSFGQLTAPTVCQTLKISSPRDSKQLALAKDQAYKDGFYNGRMIIGQWRNVPVKIARESIRRYLIETGMAIDYWEPESQVLSRSGDECVVALTDQWYLNYENAEWKAKVHDCIDNHMEINSETRQNLKNCVDWLNDWACARKYGLGTRLPWDEQWLIESLSDSTVYMAFYTVAHVIDKFGITHDHLTDQVWNYVFEISEDFPADSAIPVDVLQKMKLEFSYFYPVDLRVSGKDLLNNHLTFSLFNHTALFPRDKWPKSIRCNGHLLLNGEKMSKSTGNFLTLSDAIEKYGADATRLALAEGGDGLDDANFEEEVANANILKLYTLKEWMESNYHHGCSIPDSSFLWAEQVFINEMNECMWKATQSYDKMEYFMVTKWGFHSMLRARDFYINYLKTIDRNSQLNSGVIKKYIEYQTLIMAPIIPHFSEYVWTSVLKKPSDELVVDHAWPTVSNSDINPVLSSQKQLLDHVLKECRSHLGFLEKRMRKMKQQPHHQPINLVIYASKGIPEWQSTVLSLMNNAISRHADTFSNQYKPQDFLVQLQQELGVTDVTKDKKLIMPYINHIYSQMKHSKLPYYQPPQSSANSEYDECDFLQSQRDFIASSLDMKGTCGGGVSIQFSPKAAPGSPIVSSLQHQ